MEARHSSHKLPLGQEARYVNSCGRLAARTARSAEILRQLTFAEGPTLEMSRQVGGVGSCWVDVHTM